MKVKAAYEERTAVVEVSGLQINSSRFNVHYSLDGNNSGIVDVYFPTLSCEMSVDSKGKVWRVQTPSSFSTSKNRSYHERRASEWEATNGEMTRSSPERLRKAQLLWDKVYPKLMSIDSIRKLIERYPAYLAKRDKRNNCIEEKREANRKKRQLELERRLKGTPDPLDSLVALLQ